MKWMKTHEPELEENYVEIHYREMDAEVENVIACLQPCEGLMGRRDKETRLLKPADVYYCEIVDRKCYAYLEQEVWNIEEGLQELIEKYGNRGFVRISKSMLVNLYRIDRLVADLNMRVKIVLENGEVVILNRSYRNQFYDRLKNAGMEERKHATYS